MRTGRGLRKRRSEAEWDAILRRFAASGLSAREFCRQEGVALSSLQRWGARLGQPSSGEFVDLTLPAAHRCSTSGWMVELTLPNGVSLRLRG